MGDALRKECDDDPFYHTCAKAGVKGHECKGKITWEHALYFSGSKLQKKFAIVPLCEFGHGVNTHQDGGDMKKDLNEWIALSLATPEERFSISKAESKDQRLKYLETIYGKYDKGAAMNAFEVFKKERGYLSQDGILFIGEKREKKSGPTPAGIEIPSYIKGRESKGFWYPLSEAEKQLVKKSIEWHKENLDEHYTPFQMIRKMIEEYSLIKIS